MNSVDEECSDDQESSNVEDTNIDKDSIAIRAAENWEIWKARAIELFCTHPRASSSFSSFLKIKKYKLKLEYI